MSETNQARKLKFSVLLATYINFSAWGRLGYMHPSLFFSFWTPISPKLIEVGIEIWYVDGCVGLHLVLVALLSQRRLAMLRVSQ